MNKGGFTKAQFVLIPLLIIGVAATFYFYQKNPGNTTTTPPVTVAEQSTIPPATVPGVMERRTVQVGKTSIAVEIAKTPQDQEKGLSGRASLPADGGMVFVFEQKIIPAFWMKDMQIPLDFIWVDDTKVVDLTENVPPAKGTENLSLYQPKVPVNNSIEVNAGFIKKHGIVIGDTVTYVK